MPSPSSLTTGEFVDAQVQIFTRELPRYQALGRALEHALRASVKALGYSDAIVQTRAKTIPSFAEKCIRKRQKYRQPAFQLTDLCGGRVILTSKKAVAAVCEEIRRTFDIDEANSEDTVSRLGDTQFGYRSVHFVVSLRPGVDSYGSDLPPELFEHRSAEQAREQGLPIGPVYKAEIQVRTLLQHAWATLLHDRMYKHERESTPAELIRESGRIAASLENADHALLALTERFDSFTSCYGAYLDDKRMVEELEVLRGTLRHDPNNVGLALRVANIELARGRPADACAVLEPFENAEHASVRRVIGRAYWKTGEKHLRDKAEHHLFAAERLSPADADVLCELGDFLSDCGVADAAEKYRAAYRAAPDSVRALLSFLTSELKHGRTECVAAARPSLLAAIRTSSDLVSVGIHVPHGYFDIAVCHLLLEDAYPALTALALGSQMSTSDEPLERLFDLLTHVQAGASVRESLVRQLRWARSMLRCLLVARANARLRARTKGRHDADAALALARAHGDEKEVREATDKHASAKAIEEKARQELETARDQWLIHPSTRRRFGNEVRFASDYASNKDCALAKDRVVVVAGGCDPSVEAKIAAYASLLDRAFQGYRGIVVSGGTRAGVSKLVAEIESRSDLIKVAYLPATIPSKAPEDRKYDKSADSKGYDVFAYTSEPDYSPLDSIQFWLDALSLGRDPSELRVLGINGGRHSAFEYRLALAMGARVGVLRDTGREASKIAEDPQWRRAPGLCLLPTDEDTLVAFIQPSAESSLLDDATRTEMAKHIHAEFCVQERHSSTQRDPRLAPWEVLTESLRKSNMAQVADIERKLSRLGLEVSPKNPNEIVLYEFNAQQFDDLARMEHGRWVMERLEGGWRLGAVKDVEKRINPNLISWDALSEEEKKKDYDMVARIPAMLRDHAGLEIRDPEGSAR